MLIYSVVFPTLVGASNSSNKKTLHSRGIIDPYILHQAIYGNDDASTIKHLRKLGCYSYIEGDNIYIRAPEAIFSRGKNEDPFHLGNEKLQKFNSLPAFRKLSHSLFGNANSDLINEFCLSYRISAGRKILYAITGKSYKKNIYFQEVRIPILKIVYRTNTNINTEYLGKENQFVKGQSIALRIMNNFAETPSFLSNTGKADTTSLENALHNLGYLNGRVIKKLILFSRKGACIVYIIDEGKKYLLNDIIVHSKFLSEKEMGYIRHHLKLILQKQNLAIGSKREIESIVEGLGYKCTQINRVSREEGMFEVHIHCENSLELENIENIYLQNFHIKSAELYRMMSHHGIYIGGQFNESKIQPLISDLKKFSGSEVSFNTQNEQGRILIFDAGRPPERRATQNLFRYKSSEGIEIVPVKFRWFALFRKPMFFFVEPGITAEIGNFFQTLKVGCNFHLEYLTHKNWLLYGEANVPVRISEVGNAIHDFFNYKSRDNEKSVFVPSMRLGARRVIGRNEIDVGLKYFVSNENARAEELFRFLNKRRKINNKSLEHVSENLFTLSMELKRGLFYRYNRKLDLIVQPQLLQSLESFRGGKLKAGLYYSSRVLEYSIVAALIGATSFMPRAISALHDFHDFRMASIGEVSPYIRDVVALRILLLKELADSSSIIGMRIAILSCGLFANGGIINSPASMQNLNISCWKGQLRAATGMIITLDIGGMFCIFISIGVNLEGKVCTDYGIITNLHSSSLEIPGLSRG